MHELDFYFLSSGMDFCVELQFEGGRLAPSNRKSMSFLIGLRFNVPFSLSGAIGLFVPLAVPPHLGTVPYFLSLARLTGDMAQLGLVGCGCTRESEHVSLSVMCCHIRPNLCGDDGEEEGMGH